jgi:hypothetical protein
MDLIPDNLLNVPLKDLQLNLLTIFIVSQILGRGYSALKKNGGLRGIGSAIWFGTNTPTPTDNDTKQ